MAKGRKRHSQTRQSAAPQPAQTTQTPARAREGRERRRPHSVRALAVPAGPRDYRRYWPYLLIAALGFVVFANSLRNGFVYDDVQIIRDNTRITSPWNFGDIFGTSYWHNTQQGTSIYRPLTIWSFAVDRALFGLGAFGVHLMNVVANIVAAMLMYLFLLRLLGRMDIALLASVVFVVHPIHTEVVANGVGRAELHCAIAVFAACILHLAHIRAWESGAAANKTRGPDLARRSWLLLGAAMLLYFIGLLFKENAVTLPGLVFFAEWLILNDGSLKRTLPRIWRYFIYALPLAIYMVVRTAVIGGGIPAPQEVTIGASRAVQVLHSSGVMLRYMGQMIYPMWMSAEYSDYNNPVRAATSDPVAIASVFVWLALAGFVYWLVRRKQWVPVFGIAWFFVSMLPTANILFPIGTIRADRLLYLPSAGFCLVVAWYICQVPVRARRMALAAAGIWILALSGRSIVRNADWRTTNALWPVTIRDNPGSAIGWGFIGDMHREKGETTTALECYTRAVELRAKMGVLYPEASNNRAQMLVALGRSGEAAEIYRGVLKKYPKNYVALVNLSELYMRDQLKLSEAQDMLRRAIDVKGSDFRAHANLAEAHVLGRQPQAALPLIEKAIELNPTEPLLYEQKARILDVLGRKDEAKAARVKRVELQRASQQQQPRR